MLAPGVSLEETAERARVWKHVTAKLAWSMQQNFSTSQVTVKQVTVNVTEF